MPGGSRHMWRESQSLFVTAAGLGTRRSIVVRLVVEVGHHLGMIGFHLIDQFRTQLVLPSLGTVTTEEPLGIAQHEHRMAVPDQAGWSAIEHQKSPAAHAQ